MVKQIEIRELAAGEVGMISGGAIKIIWVNGTPIAGPGSFDDPDNTTIDPDDDIW